MGTNNYVYFIYPKTLAVLRPKNNFFEIHIQPQFSLKGEVHGFVSNHFVKKRRRMYI